VQSYCADALATLAGAAKPFGLSAPAVHAVEIWEDVEHGLLPPHIVAELTLGNLVHRFPVPVGAFHDTTKDDQIFELCMLRAEAHQELDGRGDGATLERMIATERQLADWAHAVFE